jgi:hypothetical protein
MGDRSRKRPKGRAGLRSLILAHFARKLLYLKDRKVPVSPGCHHSLVVGHAVPRSTGSRRPHAAIAPQRSVLISDTVD